jgi:hypothetical protein
MRIIDPYIPSLRNEAVIFEGNRSNRIWEPSSGGSGSILNANRKTFRNTPYQKKFTS